MSDRHVLGVLHRCGNVSLRVGIPFFYIISAHFCRAATNRYFSGVLFAPISHQGGVGIRIADRVECWGLD
jgi:hypothetical protein